MKRYFTTVALLSLISCSSQVPSSPYYQNLTYYNQVQNKAQYTDRSRSTTTELRDTLYKEREWSKRQLAQKDATIEGLRKELYETRAYVSELMAQLSALNKEQIKNIPIYDLQDSYEQVGYSMNDAKHAVVFVSAPAQVRQSVQRASITMQEEPQEKDVLPMNSVDDMLPPARTTPITPITVQEYTESASPAPSPQPRIQENQAQKKSASSSQSKDLYEQAMDLLKQRKYEEARSLFDSFIEQYPRDTLIPNAWYWKAETYYSLGDYPTAITTFITIVNGYPKSNKAPDALLKIVMCYSALKDIPNAKKYRDVLLTSYPTSNSAKKARQMVF